MYLRMIHGFINYLTSAWVEPSNVSLPTDLFPSTFRSHQRGAFQGINHHFLIRKSMAQSRVMGHSRLVPGFGIYISIDFPLKKIHIHFGDFIIPKNRCFFLRNIENYTSPDVFSPRKKPRNPFVRTQFQIPTFFPSKESSKKLRTSFWWTHGLTPSWVTPTILHHGS